MIEPAQDMREPGGCRGATFIGAHLIHELIFNLSEHKEKCHDLPILIWLQLYAIKHLHG